MIDPSFPKVYYDPFTHRMVYQDDEPAQTIIVKWPVAEVEHATVWRPANEFLRFDPADRSLHLWPRVSGGLLRVGSWEAGIVTECRPDAGCSWRRYPFDLSAPLLYLADPSVVTDLESGRQALTIEMGRRYPAECFAAAIPASVRAVVRRFALVQFRLLRAIAADARVSSLIESNPALVFLAAALFQETGGSAVHRRGFVPLLFDKRRTIISFATGYEEERVVRVLSKIRCAVWNGTALDSIRTLLCDGGRMRMLSHFDLIPASVALWIGFGPMELPDTLAAFFHRLVAGRKESSLEVIDAAAEAAGRLFLDTRRLVPDRDLFVRQVNECRDLDDMQRLHDRQVLHWMGRDRELEIEHYRDSYGTLDFPPPPIRGSNNIVPIVTIPQLLAEGKSQRHCIGSYVGSVMHGNTYVYRVMKPQRATLELVKQGGRWVINQMRLACNGEPDEKTWEAVRAWCAGAADGVH